MSIFALCGCAVVVCILIITVKQHRPDIALVLALAAGVVLFTYIIIDMNQVITEIYELLAGLSDYSDEIRIIVKSLGVCIVTQLAADVCRDSGQITVASRVELGGKVAVLLLLIPLFGNVLDISSRIING